MFDSRVKLRRLSWPIGILTLAIALTPIHVAGQRNRSGDWTSDDAWMRDCDDRGGRDSEVFCDVRVQTVAARGLLRVDAGQNGGIVVVGSDRRDFEVHARIQTRASTVRAAREIADEIGLDLSGSTITANGPDVDRRESWSVTFVVFVPRRTNLDLQAHNGPLAIDDVNGRIEAKTVNGPLSLSDVSGDVSARTQNGPLNIELSGARWDGTGLDAETRNGPVRLSIPDGYSAELETGTVNGPFDTEVPLTVTQIGRVNRLVESRLGRGGAPIRAITTNGPVTIRRR